jgi:hypothetical protein
MREVISNDAFFDEIRTLNPGDVGHHAMLFPAVYPPDRDRHEEAKQGFPLKTDNPFFDIARDALKRGVRLEWLRVLPQPGEFGCDEEDITAMLRSMGAIARVGFDVRTVSYSDHAPHIIKYRNVSPVIQDYLQGLEISEPRKSSWATFRRQQTGKLALHYLDTMDYKNGIFTGHVRHSLPADQHVAKWTSYWRDTYKNYGRPVSPLIS